MSSSAAAKIAPTSSWKDLATRYNAAWNAHDVAAIMAFHADDTSYQRHGSPKVYKGKESVAEQFGKDISGLPGIKFEPVALYGSDDHFVSE